MSVAIHYHRFIVGGIERVILRQIDWFHQLGVKVFLLLDQEPDEGNSFTVPEFAGPIIMTKDPALRKRKLLSFCEGHGVTVYIEHFYHDVLKPNSRILDDLNWLEQVPGLKKYLWWHAEYTYGGVSASLEERRQAVKEKLKPVLAGICCLSRVDAAFFSSCGIRARFVPNEVGLKEPKSNPGPKSSRNVLWLARLDKDKNPFDALEIFAIVHKNIPEATFTMVGGGEPALEEKLRSRAQALGLTTGCLNLTGIQYEVDKFYNEASVFLMTSGHEGFAITLVEAASRGLPIVSYAIPQAEPLRMNHGAIQVPQRDIKRAADALVSLFRNGKKYQQAKKGSLAAFRELASFDYKALYRSMVGDSFVGEPNETDEDRELVNVLAENRWNPLVSIIVPVFNTENYLKDCLDSLTTQRYRHVEILCIDDGSTDSSSSILADYAKADNRIKVLTQSNSGQGAARNKALDIASGRYIYFMDSDDCLEQSAIGEMVARMENDKLDHLIFSSSVFSDEPKTPELVKTIVGFEHYYEPPQIKLLYKVQRGSDLFKELLLEKKFTVSPPLRMIRREVIEANGIRFPEGHIHEDWGFTPLTLIKSERAEFIPNKYYQRRVRSGSTMTADDESAEIRHFLGYVNAIAALYDSPCVDRDLASQDRTGILVLATLAKTVGYKGSSCESLLLNQKAVQTKTEIGLGVLEFKGDEHSQVSVILPIHNVALYLDKCLDSIEGQTYHNLEIICVDDGSTDGSLAVVNRHAEHDKRYKVLHTEQGGAGAARNRGLSIAKGEYVFFHDPDDFSNPNLIGEAVARANRTNADVVLWGRYSYDSQSEKVTGVANLPAAVRALPEVFSYSDAPELSLVNFGFAPWNKLVRRSFMEKHGIRFQEIPRNNDVCFSSSVILWAERISVLPGPYYYYRINRKGGLQNTIDSTPYTTFEALMGVKQCMAATGKADLFNDSFIKQAFKECLVKMLSFNSAEVSEKFYRRMKTTELANLGINEQTVRCLDAEDRETYFRIISGISFSQFMLEETKWLKSVSADLSGQLRNVQRQLKSAGKTNALNDGSNAGLTISTEFHKWRIDIQYDVANVGSIIPDVGNRYLSLATATWLKGDGVNGMCAMATVLNGRISFKCRGTGTISIALRGPDVRAKDGKDRIPVWVDFVSVKVYGRDVLKKLWAIRHDKPYKSTIDVKAGETVEIAVETVPHVYPRAVLRDMLLKAKLPVEVTGKNVDAILDEPAMLAFQRRPMEEVAGVLGSWNVDCHYTEAEVGAFELTNGDVDVWSGLMHGTDAFLRVVGEASRRKLTFKSKGAGDVRIALMGPAVFAATDGKTPLPTYADFTSVKVRGKEMLAKPVSVCRTKPHWFTIKVAAGEWVDVEVSTAPHVYGRGALKELLLNGKWPVSVPPVCVDEWLAEPLFNRYLTKPMDTPEDLVWTPNLWRMDWSYAAADVVKLEPIGNSTDLAVTSPAWMNRSGKGGLSIAGSAFRSQISCEAQGAGQVTVNLRGQDIRMRADGKSRVPFYVDYTSVKVRGVEMLKEKVSVWHDRPHKFTIDVQAGETFEIAVVTTPHAYSREGLRELLLKAKLPVAVTGKNVDQILDAPEMAAFLLRPQEEFARALSTWCMDAHYVEKEVGALEVVKESEGVRSEQADWMKTKAGVFRRVTCTKFGGVMSFKSKGAGKVKIALHGQERYAVADGKTRMLVPVDFISLKVRGKELLGARTVVDCAEHSAWITLDVKAGETVEIAVETAPHVYRREELKELMLKVKWPVAVPPQSVDAWLDDLVLKSFIAVPSDLKIIENHKLQIAKLQAELKKGEGQKSQIAKLQAELKKGEGQKSQIAKLREELKKVEERKSLIATGDGASDRLRQQEAFVSSLSTWCMDAHFGNKEVGALELVRASDGVNVCQANWMKTKGGCFQRLTCTRFAGRASFVCKGAGKVSLALLGQDLRRATGDKVPVSIPVDFVSVKVRGKEMLAGRTVVDRAHPAWLMIRVKAGETVEIAVETAPHVYRREELKELMLKVKWPVAVPAQSVDAWLDDLVLRSFIAVPSDLKTIENHKLQIAKLQAELKKGEAQKLQIAKLQEELKKGEAQKLQIAKLQAELKKGEELKSQIVKPQTGQAKGAELPQGEARTKVSKRSQKEARRVAVLERRAEENARRAEEMLARLQEANAKAEAEKKKVEELQSQLAIVKHATAYEKRMAEAKAKEVADLKASEAYQVGMSLTKPARAIKRALTGGK